MGQHQGNPAAEVFPADYFEITAVAFGDPFGDGQAQACPTRGPGPRLVGSIETVKNVRNIPWWNTNPGILHGEPSVFVLGAHDQADGPSGRRVLDGIINQNTASLLHQALIRQDEGFFGLDLKDMSPSIISVSR